MCAYNDTIYCFVGLVWLFLGGQIEGHISRLDCNDGLAKPLNIKVLSCVMRSLTLCDIVLTLFTHPVHLVLLNKPIVFATIISHHHSSSSSYKQTIGYYTALVFPVSLTGLFSRLISG